MLHTTDESLSSTSETSNTYYVNYIEFKEKILKTPKLKIYTQNLRKRSLGGGE